MESLEALLGMIVGMLASPADTAHTKTGTNAAVTITLPAVAGKASSILSLSWSYSDDPTGGGITINDGGNPVKQWDITVGGPGFLPVFLQGSPGGVVTVTLKAGGAGIVGKLNIQAVGS